MVFSIPAYWAALRDLRPRLVATRPRSSLLSSAAAFTVLAPPQMPSSLPRLQLWRPHAGPDCRCPLVPLTLLPLHPQLSPGAWHTLGLRKCFLCDRGSSGHPCSSTAPSVNTIALCPFPDTPLPALPQQGCSSPGGPLHLGVEAHGAFSSPKRRHLFPIYCTAFLVSLAPGPTLCFSPKPPEAPTLGVPCALPVPALCLFLLILFSFPGFSSVS